MSSKNPGFKLNHWVLIVLFVFFAVRLLFFGFVHPWDPETEKTIVLDKDALGYHDLACTLVEHHRFAYSSTDVPNTVRTPFYPMFIAGIYTVFGYKPWVVMLFQILIGALSCLLLIMILTRLFNQQVAVIAAFFFAIDPFLIVYTTSLLSDSLFVAFLIFVFYWFSRGFVSESQGKSVAYYGLSGFIIGLSTLIRPISQYIPVLLIFFFLVWYRKKLTEALKYSIAVLIMFFLAISPWLIRNYHYFGRPAISSAGSLNLLVEYAVPMVQQQRNKDMKTVQSELLAEAEQKMRKDGLQPQNLNSFEKSDYYRDVAFKYIKGDPVHFMRTYIMGIVHTIGEMDSSAFTFRLGIPMPKVDMKAYTNIIDLAKEFIRQKGTTGMVIAGLLIPYLLVSYSSAVVGFMVSWKRYNWGALLWCFLMAAYFVIVSGVGGSARFKIPSMPFYMVFSGIGITYLREKMRKRRIPEKGN